MTWTGSILVLLRYTLQHGLVLYSNSVTYYYTGKFTLRRFSEHWPLQFQLWLLQTGKGSIHTCSVPRHPVGRRDSCPEQEDLQPLYRPATSVCTIRPNIMSAGWTIGIYKTYCSRHSVCFFSSWPKTNETRRMRKHTGYWKPNTHILLKLWEGFANAALQEDHGLPVGPLLGCGVQALTDSLVEQRVGGGAVDVAAGQGGDRGRSVHMEWPGIEDNMIGKKHLHQIQRVDECFSNTYSETVQYFAWWYIKQKIARISISCHKLLIHFADLNTTSCVLE